MKLQNPFSPKAKKTKITLTSLNRWNKIMAGLHALQGVTVLVLARDVTFPISTRFLTLDPLASSGGQPVLVDASRALFDINLAYLVAAFFFMSAVSHWIMAMGYRDEYEKNLKKGINRARWYEYMFSASTMMVAIAVLAGVYELSALVMIFALTAVMNSMGLMMELHNQTTRRTDWTSFVIGSIAAVVPWLVIAVYLWGSNLYGTGQIPTFVYWVYGSLLVFFNCFAINMFLQYKKVGRWADYLYGEKVYMVLSLVAKSALAWQVFFGALRP